MRSNTPTGTKARRHAGTKCCAKSAASEPAAIPFVTSCLHAFVPSFRSAYTLIELLIVIAIMGISGALLIPNMVNRDSMNVQSAVRLIIGDLSFAQSDALAHQELRRVHFYDDGRGYCLIRLSSNADIN